MPLLNDEITLYKLKQPLTGLYLTPHGAINTLAFEVHHKIVGRVQIPLEDTQIFLLNLCADTRVVVGTLSQGEVEWFYDPSAFGFDTVIDSLGNLHDARSL